MKLLLDTHTLLWYAQNDPQLSSMAQSLIQDMGNEVFVSPASYWEVAIKISIGKYSLNTPYETFMEQAIDGNLFRVLPILVTHTSVLTTLPFPKNHKDPFDRLIVAQAIAEQMSIVSNDDKLDDYPVRRLW